MAALAANGVANFTVTPSSAVGNEGPTQLVLQLAYPGVPAEGTGKYSLNLTLNAAIEAEPFGVGGNDSQAQAQDIDASFIPLSSDRGAVVGTLIGPNSFDPPTPIPVPEEEPNNSRAGAQNLDGELWTVAPDPNIQDAKTIPHVSVLGSGDGTFDYYSFTVSTPGAVGIFDIDFANFDSQLFLYDNGGTLLASNDDTVPADPGSASVLDAKIDFTFSSPGTYVIAVGEFFSEDAGGSVQGNSPDAGESYTLHVSVENHPIDPGTPIPQDDRDFYRFDAVQGDVITLAATAVSGSADSMSLQLLDSSGTVLATGSSGAENVDRFVQDYEIQSLATYFVRVGSTNDDVDYSLVITRNATFDLGLPGAQNIDATDTVLGHVGESLAPIEVIEFDELPEQPLDGVSVKGATFDFKVGGADRTRPLSVRSASA